MPCNYSKYPANWKVEIRPRILERARNHCESCGVRDGASIRRMVNNAAVYRYWNEAGGGGFLDSDRRLASFYDNQAWHPPVKVVLTIAHIDQNIEHNDERNLAAWCQRCHLMYDQRVRGIIIKALTMIEEAQDKRPQDLNVVKSIVGKKKAGRKKKAS